MLTASPSSLTNCSPTQITLENVDILATDSLFTYEDHTINNSDNSCVTPNPLRIDSEDED
jgi:hypothetical protein